MKLILILTFTITMTLSSLVSSQIYKWVDKQGNVAYSTKPPPSKKIKTEEIKIHPFAKMTRKAIQQKYAQQQADKAEDAEFAEKEKQN